MFLTMSRWKILILFSYQKPLSYSIVQVEIQSLFYSNKIRVFHIKDYFLNRLSKWKIYNFISTQIKSIFLTQKISFLSVY
jgi:hypothetical protein